MIKDIVSRNVTSFCAKTGRELLHTFLTKFSLKDADERFTQTQLAVLVLNIEVFQIKFS